MNTCRLCRRDIPRGLSFCHTHHRLLDDRERLALMNPRFTLEQRTKIADRAAERLRRETPGVALERPSAPPEATAPRSPAVDRMSPAVAAFRRARELVAGIVHPEPAKTSREPATEKGSRR